LEVQSSAFCFLFLRKINRATGIDEGVYKN